MFNLIGHKPVRANTNEDADATHNGRKRPRILLAPMPRAVFLCQHSPSIGYHVLVGIVLLTGVTAFDPIEEHDAQTYSQLKFVSSKTGGRDLALWAVGHCALFERPHALDDGDISFLGGFIRLKAVSFFKKSGSFF